MASRIDADQVASPLVRGEHHDHAYFEHLKNKLRWQLLVAYVTPLLLLSGFFHFQYSNALRVGVDNHLRSIAENRRNTVDLFIQERISNVRNVFSSEDQALPLPPELMEARLQKLQRESPTFTDLGLFDPSGTLVAYAGPFPNLLGRNYSGEDWLQRLMDDPRGAIVSDVFLGFRASPHFIVAVRRAAADGEWVLRASVDPKEFGEFVARSYLIDKAEAFIVNAHGERQTLSGAHEQHEPSNLPPRTADTLVAEVEVEGERYLRALAWLTSTEWALVVRVPVADAYASLRNARLVLVSIMVAALLFIIWVVRSSTRRLVSRLESADKAKEDLRLQLFNAAKLASVGEMAAGVAHEINNPLAIIYEEASMMKDLLDPQFGQQLPPEELTERLDAIRDAAMRGRDITRKLMAFARRHEPEPEPTDVNHVVERSLGVKENDFKFSNIEVVRELADGLPPIAVGRNQLDQVLLNLLNNAKDAIQSAGTITVRTRRRDTWIEIEVADTGCGMPEEVIQRVFFPFYTTKGVGKGTGLGLSISYGIVKSLGGRIEVQSEVGQGTTFTIMLPVPKDVGQAAGTRAA